MNRKIFFTMIFAMIVIAAGCSGGGGGDQQGNNVQLSGTVATGAPITGATVELRDSNGVYVTAVTGTDGKYSLSSILTLPSLLRVSSNAKTYYSLATDNGTVNIHPLTDLIIRNWYSVQGVDLETAFNAASALPAAPTATEIDTIEAVIRSLLADLFLSVGIDGTTFNLFTSTFEADNTGFDNILDRTAVTIDAGGTATITMVDPNTGTEGNTILSMPISAVPTTIGDAKTGINAMLANLVVTMNTNSCTLDQTHINPYVTANYLDNGYDESIFAEVFKNMLGCPGPFVSINDFFVTDLVSFDSVNLEAVGAIQATYSNGNGNYGDHVRFKFVDGSWRWDGNQEDVEIQVLSRAEKQIRSGGTTTNMRLSVRVNDYLNVISSPSNSVYVSGTGMNKTIAQTCGPDLGYNCENGSISSFAEDTSLTPTVGSVYSVSIAEGMTTKTYIRTLIMTPGVTGLASDFPNFTGLTTNLFSNIAKETPVTATVYTPAWVTEVKAPRLNLYAAGGAYLGYIDTSWTGTALRGQNNQFTFTIPTIYNAQTVAGAHLQQNAGGYGIPGWGETSVSWYFDE